MNTQRTFIPFFLLLILCLPVAAGETAPDFTLPKVGGGEITLSDLRGRVVYLDFWATWCPPCRKSFPWMDEMQQRYRDDGLVIVAVSIDRKQELIGRFIREVQPGFIVAHDQTTVVFNRFGVQAMPTSYLINRAGNIVYTNTGFRPSDKDKLESQIQELL